MTNHLVRFSLSIVVAAQVACTDPPTTATTTTTTTTTTATVTATATATTPPEVAPATPTKTPDPRVAIAREVATGLGGQLLATVEAAMKQSGPVGALQACKLSAPTLTAAAQRAEAAGGVPVVAVGRTATKRRNPDNAPAPWMVPLLTELEAQPADARHPVTTSLPEGRLGVLLPIVTQKPCLTCHGQELASEVETALKSLYPSDTATGFAEGDLRGAFWVEVGPIPPAPASGG